MNMSQTRVLALALTLYLSRLTASIAADAASAHDADYDYDPPLAGSYALPVIKVAPDGAIIDSGSKSLNLSQLTHGRITVLSFIYTRCAAPKACPKRNGPPSSRTRPVKDGLSATRRRAETQFRCGRSSPLWGRACATAAPTCRKKLRRLVDTSKWLAVD